MTLIFSLLKFIVTIMLSVTTLLGSSLKAETVDVELYANPASGYSWSYYMDKSGVLSFSKSAYTPDSSSILSGGGGTQKYTFRAVDSGTVKITFRYVNNIDGDIASTYVYTYTVTDDGEIILKSIE